MAVHGTHNAVHDDRNDKVLIYVNGELFPRDEARISVFDSGYLVDDGVWEALRLHDGVLVSVYAAHSLSGFRWLTRVATHATIFHR